MVLWYGGATSIAIILWVAFLARTMDEKSIKKVNTVVVKTAINAVTIITIAVIAGIVMNGWIETKNKTDAQNVQNPTVKPDVEENVNGNDESVTK